MSGATAQALRAAAQASAPAWDRTLMAIVAALLGAGLVMVYSASTATEAGGPYYLARHAVHIALGLVAAVLVARVPVHGWHGAGPVLIVLAVVLLALVFVPGLGVHVHGSTRWLRLGPITFQPSEFAKVFVVVYTAGFLTRRREQLAYLTRGVLAIGVVVGVIGTLLVKEPDFGGFVVIVLTVAGMLFLGGVRFRHFLVCVLVGAVSIAVMTLLSPYRLERIKAVLDPWSDPFGAGFQLVQAQIAFGRGEWFGVGLGASIQKLNYLPAPHTDFLLAIAAEELGFVGVAAFVALFAALTARAFWIARRAERIGDVFAARLAYGIGLLLGLQAMINMGVNMGVLPTKGLALPLVSYGGSSMVASCLAVGLLAAVYRETRPVPGARR